MSGLTRKELVNRNQRSARVVSLLVATTMTPEVHGGRVMLLSLLAGFTVTLPAAVGSGIFYEFRVGIVRTSGSYIVQVANASDNFEGSVVMIDTDSPDNEATGFVTTSNTSDTLTMDATTTGGLTIGDWFEFLDVAVNTWHVRGILSGSGSIATPFSAAV